MNTYTIFTDTDTDLTPEEARYFGYKMISMPYSINGQEFFPYKDNESFDFKTFYDTLRSGVIPSTFGISTFDYINYFEPELKKGLDVLYVHFSSAMSGTFNALKLAIDELKLRYPERSIHLIDTKGITLGSYNIVLEIGDLYLQGKSIEEIKQWAQKEVDRFAIYFFADDLKFFGKSGRVSGMAAFMGNIIGIRPIIYMDSDGVMKAKDKCRGRKQTLQKLLNYVIDLQDDIKSHRIIVGHTDAIELAEEFGSMLKKQFGDDIRLSYQIVNPTAGSHCGPNGIGVSFHAKHR